MLAFELVVMREVSKSNLCFEITLVSFPPEFHFIQYKKKINLGPALYSILQVHLLTNS